MLSNGALRRASYLHSCWFIFLISCAFECLGYLFGATILDTEETVVAGRSWLRHRSRGRECAAEVEHSALVSEVRLASFEMLSVDGVLVNKTSFETAVHT